MAQVLILTGNQQFQRRNLRTTTGLAVVIKKGESFKVEDDVALALLDTENGYGQFDADDNWVCWFRAADGDVTPTHDFTAEPVSRVRGDRPETATEHDDDALDGVTKTVKDKAPTAVATKRSQRTRAA